jgi:N-acetylglutamate synthase-like GNAT family acetyltransferase
MAHTGLRLRAATPAQAPRIFAAIAANVESGHLLPRTREDVTAHVSRFVVAMRGRRLAGFAELAPLSAATAEVRSLVVLADERGNGVGQALVAELARRARAAGFDKLCAFTHAPAYFAHMGFSIVPHVWVPEKVFADCVACPLFRRCGQTAMAIGLAADDDVRERLPEAAVTAAPHSA